MLCPLSYGRWDAAPPGAGRVPHTEQPAACCPAPAHLRILATPANGSSFRVPRAARARERPWDVGAPAEAPQSMIRRTLDSRSSQPLPDSVSMTQPVDALRHFRADPDTGTEHSMQKLNRHVEVRHRGGPEALEVVEGPLPKPEHGEVRVRVLAAGVSAYDRMMRAHWFPGFPKLPYTPGLDAVGVVDAWGGGVSSPAIGAAVAGGPWPEGGGYSHYLCRRAEDLLDVPDGLDPAEVTCLITDFLTAHQMMHDTAHVKAGDRVLVHGAAGGVGSALLQLGHLAGLEMYGTASAVNADLVTSLGATPIDYQTQEFVSRTLALTGDGVDVVFDPIGGASQLRRSYQCLRPGGQLVWFGVAAVSRQGIRVIPESLLTRTLLTLRRDGRRVPLPRTAEGGERKQEVLAELISLLANDSIHPRIQDRIPLTEAADAHALLERGGHQGKVVLIPGS